MAKPVPSGKKPQDRLQQAMALHQTGDYKTAELRYKQLLQDSSEDQADILHLLGILCGQQGRLSEAEDWLTKALALQPESATFHNSLGNVQRRLQHLDQAIVHYQKALALEPNLPAVHNNLGIVFQQQKDWQQACQHFEKAIALKPHYVDARFNFSTVLTLLERYREAIAQLQMAVRLQPEHAQAQGQLGQILLQQGKPGQALKHLQARLRLDPDSVETHHQLAVALTQLNQFDSAIEQYEATLKLQPKHTEALHNLGVLYLTQRNPDMALRSYLRLLRIQPDLDTYYNLGIIHSYQDRFDDAIHFFKEALRLQPEYYNAEVNLGAAYLKKEDFANATHHYEQALKLRPGDPEIEYILAAIAQKSTPTTAPTQYIEHLFDQYAPHFDQHLREHLDYQVPRLLSQAMMQAAAMPPQGWVILDLGCGTGLCGLAFAPFAKRLIGIDVSENMLASARAKKVYDELEKMEINRSLGYYTNIDLVIAGDVFGYVGELAETFDLVAKAVKQGGYFAFTVEKSETESIHLQNNARFAHNRQYIQQLAVKSGFLIEKCEEAILRQQKQLPVKGYVFVLKKEF